MKTLSLFLVLVFVGCAHPPTGNPPYLTANQTVDPYWCAMYHRGYNIPINPRYCK